jgi:hypothetical protein
VIEEENKAEGEDTESIELIETVYWDINYSLLNEYNSYVVAQNRRCKTAAILQDFIQLKIVVSPGPERYILS